MKPIWMLLSLPDLGHVPFEEVPEDTIERLTMFLSE